METLKSYTSNSYSVTQGVHGAFDDDNDISSLSATRLSDDDQGEAAVSIVSFGGYPNDNEMTDDNDDAEDVNHSAAKSADVISTTSGNVDFIREYADIDVLSSSSESIEWSDTTSPESSINSDRTTPTAISVITLDIDRVQSSLHEQISSPVVQAHGVNRQTEQIAGRQRETDNFPFLMSGSTVCEYIDREYREVVSGNSPNNEALNVHSVL